MVHHPTGKDGTSAATEDGDVTLKGHCRFGPEDSLRVLGGPGPTSLSGTEWPLAGGSEGSVFFPRSHRDRQGGRTWHKHTLYRVRLTRFLLFRGLRRGAGGVPRAHRRPGLEVSHLVRSVGRREGSFREGDRSGVGRGTRGKLTRTVKV